MKIENINPKVPNVISIHLEDNQVIEFAVSDQAARRVITLLRYEMIDAQVISLKKAENTKL